MSAGDAYMEHAGQPVSPSRASQRTTNPDPVPPRVVNPNKPAKPAPGAEQQLAQITVALTKRIEETGLYTGTFEFTVWSILHDERLTEIIPGRYAR